MTKEEEKTGIIERVSGPLVKAKGLANAQMYEIVKVSEDGLLGEIIELNKDIASIQVYEDTSGVQPGQPVYATGESMSVELGPGIMGSIYDGIQRPLKDIEDESNSFFIKRGVEAPGLARQKKWFFSPKVKEGEQVKAGDILGEVDETTLIKHKIMVPPEVEGVVQEISSGEFTVEDTVVKIKTSEEIKEISMKTNWPIRKPRPKQGKIFPTEPLATGGRSIDTFFPIAKGGAGSIPGPFGAGKTVTQQSIAKYCDAEVIVYIGCGERGNEMTEVLNEFPELTDPNTNEPLIKRTILIANTSNMPVAAREASIYTGITIAEYFRDMGYNVALMADSTSRWAEAMREISGRLEEMPGEEGYPAYLASRTSEFYERAGKVTCLGSENRIASLTIIGAVSPPGGDLSEPVSQATIRVTKSFWSLDASLAYKKHFPSINWLNSYSLYTYNFTDYWSENIAPDFQEIRAKAMDLLQREAKLLEIVKLVGQEGLSDNEKLILEIARSIREDFLFQDAFDPEDAYTTMEKQYLMLKSIITVFIEAEKIINEKPDTEINFNDISSSKAFAGLSNLKHLKEKEEFEEFIKKSQAEIKGLKVKSSHEE